MADQIGLEVGCEGVETAAQRDALVSVGATMGQGWYFSVPLERTQLAHYLGRCGCVAAEQVGATSSAAPTQKEPRPAGEPLEHPAAPRPGRRETKARRGGRLSSTRAVRGAVRG